MIFLTTFKKISLRKDPPIHQVGPKIVQSLCRSWRGKTWVPGSKEAKSAVGTDIWGESQGWSGRDLRCSWGSRLRRVSEEGLQRHALGCRVGRFLAATSASSLKLICELRTAHILFIWAPGSQRGAWRRAGTTNVLDFLLFFQMGIWLYGECLLNWIVIANEEETRPAEAAACVGVTDENNPSFLRCTFSRVLLCLHLVDHTDNDNTGDPSLLLSAKQAST